LPRYLVLLPGKVTLLLNPELLVRELFSHQFFSWCAAALAVIVSLDTVIRLWTERHRLVKDELNDEDRSFAWRLVIFVVLPLLTLIDLRATDIAANMAGGYLSHPTYGFVWYHATLQGLTHAAPATVAFVYVAGAFAQIVFALLLIPALFFRPHPFLATFLGYTVAFTLGLNLLMDPVLSLAGLGLPRWAEILKLGMADPQAAYWPIVAQSALTGLYLFFISSSAVRLWFSDLTRPQISQELRHCLERFQTGLKARDLTASLCLQLGLLYVRAGLTRQGHKVLKQMKSLYPASICTSFLRAMLAFQERKYKDARQAFVFTSDFQRVDGELKASLLAAAACSAYAQGDTEGSLDLCERALEFEDACLTARLVKVDACLAKGKKEQAAQEIMVAMHLGLNFDLKDKVPVDADQVFYLLTMIEGDAVGEDQRAKQLATSRDH
jgi:tetratricopeptide (TPR) repeat protein